MLKHLMGVLGGLLAVWGTGFLYEAATSPYAQWWIEGVAGVARWVATAMIYRRWFR